jgi:hypothetical protein
MSIYQETTREEEEEVIQKAYYYIKKHGLETAALLLIRGFGPMAPIGGALGRFFLGPLTPLMSHREEKIIWTLEKPENLQNLTKMLEDSIEKNKEGKEDISNSLDKDMDKKEK